VIDTAFCVLQKFGIVDGTQKQPKCNSFALYINSIPKGGQNSRETSQLMFGKIFNIEAFTGPVDAKNNDGAADLLVTQSGNLRQCILDYCGCSKDTMDICG
jgi:hypothetical protein